jgi:predicted aldo/keto reductase-like oxidoreductase
MNSRASRRNFLAAGLTLPAAALATPQKPQAPPAARPASGGLAFRTLGKTGLKATSVGFGCMITSDAAVISRALDMGITYFDTARFYQQGNNERMVGGALKGWRDKIVLVSKSLAKTRDEALQHLDTSLKELGTDHLDIWHMHMRDSAGAITDECLEAWQAAKKAGKIRFIGVSSHNPNNIVDRVMSAGIFDVLLSTYNFAVGTNNDATYKRLKDAGLGLVAMKVMAPAAGSRGRGGAAPKPAGPPEQFLASLKWVLRNDMMDVAIPSMVDMDQLEINFRAMTEKFGAQDEKVLVALNEEIRPLYCRMCYRCTGQCPKGAAVPETIRYLSYADFYGQFALGREHFAMLPEEARAVRCGECESCTVKCPNGVRVPERMVRAQELFA